MNLIERQIGVTYRHQVRFTQKVFAPDNFMLRDILADGQTDRTQKVLMVMDEALCRAQPNLVNFVLAYFNRHNDCLRLVCDPMQFEGGERITGR